MGERAAPRSPTDASDRVRSAREFLELEERRTRETLKSRIAELGKDVCASRLRECVRRHPELAVAASAGLGALAAPLAIELVETALVLGLRCALDGRVGLARVAERFLVRS